MLPTARRPDPGSDHFSIPLLTYRYSAVRTTEPALSLISPSSEFPTELSNISDSRGHKKKSKERRERVEELNEFSSLVCS